MRPGEGKAPAVDAEMQAFAATRRRPGPRCWMCTLPAADRERVERARKADPVTWTMQSLADFMREIQGYPQATYSRLRDHFKHAERSNG